MEVRIFLNRGCPELTPALCVNRMRDCEARKKVTRGLLEGPWDPTKIPPIQVSTSEAASLLGVGDVAFTQLKTQIGQTP